jgi:hypothetical protein
MKQVSNATKSFVLSSFRHCSNPQRGAFSKYLLVLLLAGIAMVITSCQKEKQKKAVPFKAEFQLTSVVTQEKGALIIYTTGTGTGTHIGRSSYECHARVDATGYSDVLVITAADGSEIHAVGKGPGPVIDATTGDLFITYQSTITGGTGRFTGATGILTSVGHGNVNRPEGTGSLDGTISY